MVKTREMLSQAIEELQQSLQSDEIVSLSTVPPKYDFGGPQYWKVRFVYQDQEFSTYWEGGGKAETPTIAEIFSDLTANFHLLRQFPGALAFTNEFMGEYDSSESAEKRVAWLDRYEEEKRTYPLQVETRKDFMRVFGKRWYNRLMNAEQ